MFCPMVFMIVHHVSEGAWLAVVLHLIRNLVENQAALWSLHPLQLKRQICGHCVGAFGVWVMPCEISCI